MIQPLWLQRDQAKHDVVLSTRFRLARNLRHYQFSTRADLPTRRQVCSELGRAIAQAFPHWNILAADEIAPLTRGLFFEKHLISSQLRDQPEGALIILSAEGRFVLLVNEEDHLRIQLLLPGLNLKFSWEELLRVETHLESWLEFAVHHEFGYLTSCLSNIGTGLRASVMLHLPALAWLGALGPTLQDWPDQGIEFRGTFGEGSETVASCVQLSNRFTLGATVPEITERVHLSVERLVKIERQNRQYLLHNYRTKVEDAVYRALATLGAARLLPSDEAANLLGTVRLGACLGILPHFPPNEMLHLIIETRPAHLQHRAGRVLRPDERDIFRAAHIRSQIQTLGEVKEDG